MFSYCRRGNSTVEISTPIDLPYTSEVSNPYQGSIIHSVLHHDVHHVSYCVQTQDLLMLVAQIHIKLLSSSFSLDDARVSTTGDFGTEIHYITV